MENNINEEKEEIKKCQNIGCNKEYKESENKENVCLYHSGAPIFHEGQKGYTCCSKRVLTFDEFLLIPGCTQGKHSSIKKFIKPVETSPALKELKNENIKVISSSNESETYKSTGFSINPSTSKTNVKEKEEEKKKEEEEIDPPDSIINVGTVCKHRGCNASYKDESSRLENCIYHPGAPIFHETAKMWSCCMKKSLEFDKFLEIEGCKTGKHKFLPFKNDILAQNEVNCRYDWYQMSSYIILTIFAKKVKSKESEIKFDKNKVKIKLIFEDEKIFQKEINLSQFIIPEKSTVTYLSTKVECKLMKENEVQWITLEKK
jgi:Rieske Fe-S protein